MASVRAGVMGQVDVASIGPAPQSAFGTDQGSTWAIVIWVAAVLILFVIL